VALAKQTTQQCESTAGRDLRHYTTDNTARDLVRIRQALGVAKIAPRTSS
jgi:pimeloyl-ACP methyl ester carboxylesterase